MSYHAEGVEVDTLKKAGRPQIYTHRTNCDFLKERFAAMPEVHRMILANRLEATAQFWFELGRAVTDDFETLYNQTKRAEL